jgi:2-iminobutanoate/2-iminopropanoate deaminase
MREVVSTDRAPGAVGPYSQAIRTGDLVFASGQVALDPATGELVEGGVEEQTRQVLANLSAVLEAAGTTLDRVVRATVYLTDLGDFARVNAIYAEWFREAPPARVCVEVSRLPKESLVEIDAIALLS